MSTESLCERFQWTRESETRNDLTIRYEPIQPFILLAMVRRLQNVVFVDAGANIGFYTVVVGNEEAVAEVHAFEPMPSAASAVRRNADANLHGKEVTVHELALSDHHGSLDFAVRGPLAGDNGAVHDSALAPADYSIESMPCQRLDDIVRPGRRDIVLKVDVEGHELSLLRGAVRTLGEGRGFLQIEMHESPEHADKVALLGELGWHLVTRAGPDHYFSNIPRYVGNRAATAEILEEALHICVEQSKSPQRASRRRVISGVYLQVSRSRVNALKALLRRPA